MMRNRAANFAVSAAYSVSAALCASATIAKEKTTQPSPNGFFNLDQRGGTWWLITPEGKPFLSLGLNHIDPASLRYPENIPIWRETYGGTNCSRILQPLLPRFLGVYVRHLRKSLSGATPIRSICNTK